jgi:hypothetical protein
MLAAGTRRGGVMASIAEMNPAAMPEESHAKPPRAAAKAKVNAAGARLRDGRSDALGVARSPGWPLHPGV